MSARRQHSCLGRREHRAHTCDLISPHRTQSACRRFVLKEGPGQQHVSTKGVCVWWCVTPGTAGRQASPTVSALISFLSQILLFTLWSLPLLTGKCHNFKTVRESTPTLPHQHCGLGVSWYWDALGLTLMGESGFHTMDAKMHDTEKQQKKVKNGETLCSHIRKASNLHQWRKLYDSRCLLYLYIF